MPLEIYKRGRIFWFKGRIEELPGSKYYRQSTEKTTESGARAVVADFQRRELERYYGGEKRTITFSEAVNLYPANAEMAKDLLPILDELGDMDISEITPKLVKGLGSKLYPNSSTDSWRRHVVVPIRAVINHAHELGLGPAIVIKSYSENERIRQDRRRGKQSRLKKTPGSWEWLNAFRRVAPPHLAALALFMFQTGARISQSISIGFEDLDTANSCVRLPAAKGHDAQTVKLDRKLCAELSALKPRYTRRHDGNRELCDRLFGYTRKDGVYRTWKRVCRDAKIEAIMPRAAGRHGFGTEMLVRQGLDVKTVATVGRWADASLLLKTYAHAEDAENKVLRAIRTGRVQTAKKERANKLKKKEKIRNDIDPPKAAVKGVCVSRR